jgi:hypothetical protein
VAWRSDKSLLTAGTDKVAQLARQKVVEGKQRDSWQTRPQTHFIVRSKPVTTEGLVNPDPVSLRLVCVLGYNF